jgi:hypothetical protein
VKDFGVFALEPGALAGSHDGDGELLGVHGEAIFSCALQVVPPPRTDLCKVFEREDLFERSPFEGEGLGRAALHCRVLLFKSSKLWAENVKCN